METIFCKFQPCGIYLSQGSSRHPPVLNLLTLSLSLSLSLSWHHPLGGIHTSRTFDTT